MKPPTAPERALKTLSHFQKEIAGELSVSGEAFTGAVARTVRHFAGDDRSCVVFLEQSGELAAFADESARESHEDLCPKDRLKNFRDPFAEGKFRCVDRNDGKCVAKDFASWLFIPVTTKKGTFLAVVVARERGKFSEQETEAARELEAFFTQTLKDIRRRNRKVTLIAEETRHRMLLRTQATLDRKKNDFPGLFRAIDYGACAGSDMGQTYRTGDDSVLFCVCDLTADDHERQTALVYIDTWLSILARTSLDVIGMIQKLNNDMTTRTSECYASIVLVKYSKKNSLIEASGTGSATLAYFSHDTMTSRTIAFGTAAGVKKDPEILSYSFSAKPGDIVCLCSDGITETRKVNGDLFGADAVGELIRRNYFLSAEDLANKIQKTASEVSERGVNADDRTVVVLKIE